MSTSKVTHTPGPWKTDCNDVIGPGNKKIATPVREWADAVHIVRCVNSHDALLEACRAWLDKTTSADDAMHMTKLAVKLAEGQG